MAANRDDFDAWRIVPRMLRDVERARHERRALRPPPRARRSCSSPIGVLEMVDREADLAVARAAARDGRADDVLQPGLARRWRTAPRELGDATRLFQLYWSTSERAGREPRRPRRGLRVRARSWSRSTPRSSAGARATSTSPTCRSCAARASPSTRATRSSQRLLDERRGPARRHRARSRRPTPAALKTLVAADPRLPRALRRALRSGQARAAVQTFIRIYSRPSLTWDDLAVPARAHGAADRAQGHPAPRRRPARGRRGPRRDLGLQPRRPPGRRRDLDDRGPARRSPRRSAAASRS